MSIRRAPRRAKCTCRTHHVYQIDTLPRPCIAICVDIARRADKCCARDGSAQFFVAVCLLNAILEAAIILLTFISARVTAISNMLPSFTQGVFLLMTILWLGAACAFAKFCSALSLSLRDLRTTLTNDEDFFLMSGDTLAVGAGVAFLLWLAHSGRLIFLRFFGESAAAHYGEMQEA